MDRIAITTTLPRAAVSVPVMLRPDQSDGKKSTLASPDSSNRVEAARGRSDNSI